MPELYFIYSACYMHLRSQRFLYVSGHIYSVATQLLMYSSENVSVSISLTVTDYSPNTPLLAGSHLTSG